MSMVLMQDCVLYLKDSKATSRRPSLLSEKNRLISISVTFPRKVLEQEVVR